MMNYSSEKSRDLEKATRDQSKSKNWFRAGRVTAYKFKPTFSTDVVYLLILII